jgi:Domain of unknown function (DUF4928)
MTAGKQEAALLSFDKEHVGSSKGALSMVLAVNRRLIGATFPVDPKLFETEKQGQVKGLGGGAVRKVLRSHGITRVLSEEGGRTSRGNMERMRAYLTLANDLHSSNSLDLTAAEAFWVSRVLAFFDSKPFNLRLDPAKSVRACIRNLLLQAVDRQREVVGTMYVGAVMQHLVGAKLRLVSGKAFEAHGFSVADAPSNRSGDFLLGDVAIHVTTTPSEGLIRKCVENLSSGLRPLIVTTEDGIGGARAHSKQAGIEERIDVIEIEQFLAANLYEHSGFDKLTRPVVMQRLIDAYNDMVAECESDPSLRIEFDA